MLLAGLVLEWLMVNFGLGIGIFLMKMKIVPFDKHTELFPNNLCV